MTDADSYALFSRLKFTDHMSEFHDRSIVIEAIVEDIEQSNSFRSMEAIVDKSTILPATPPRLSRPWERRSYPERILGVHFFNPAPLMRLVEIIPGLQTDPEVVERGKASLMVGARLPSWQKVIRRALS
ncbi:MAG: hypothetical protein IPH31_27065 [Lewinellaceae bacterium]|nr:hypothetical protein [Lewinellaceae bacterium]